MVAAITYPVTYQALRISHQNTWGKVMSEIAEPQPDAPVSMDATMLDQMHAAAGKASC